MASVNSNVAKSVSGQTFVRDAVRAEADRITAIAQGLFASHDNPGGHEISRGENTRRDAFVDFSGPAVLSVEFGHWTPDHKRFVEGLHILLIATALAGSR